jgi:hypothetical protein
MPLRVFLVGTPVPERSAFGMRPMTTMAAKGPRKHQRHTRPKTRNPIHKLVSTPTPPSRRPVTNSTLF